MASRWTRAGCPKCSAMDAKAPGATILVLDTYLISTNDVHPPLPLHRLHEQPVCGEVRRCARVVAIQAGRTFLRPAITFPLFCANHLSPGTRSARSRPSANSGSGRTRWRCVMYPNNAGERMLTEPDFARLSKRKEGQRPDAPDAGLDTDDLLHSQKITPDVVTTHSQVEMVRQKITLCCPSEAEPVRGFVPVLSPFGRSLAGLAHSRDFQRTCAKRRRAMRRRGCDFVSARSLGRPPHRNRYLASASAASRAL